MDSYNIYKDIAQRTKGDIYIGVVGPVRTGKSTFIKNFMESMVLPNIEDEYAFERAKDELPQSADGTAIMTTEPKFVPNEAVKIKLGDNLDVNVRLIDCVGYIVPGATGHSDEKGPRMVSTPWSKDKIPFTQAAEAGTEKVIKDHSTIALLITSDGTITDIPRENYIMPEGRIVKELKETGKPFVIILNSKDADSENTKNMAKDLEEKYQVPVIAINCKKMTEKDIENILEKILYEFPISQINFNVPKWIDTLSNDHWLKVSIIDTLKKISDNTEGIKDLNFISEICSENENIKKTYLDKIDLGCGEAVIDMTMADKLFYNILSETTGTEIDDDYKLIAIIKELKKSKEEYDKIKYALNEVNQKGYGIVTPTANDMKLEKPEIIKQGNRFGVKIQADAPSIHMIKTNIKTSISPIVGSEEQSKELIKYFNDQYVKEPELIWEYNIFGKSLMELINDDLNSKLSRLPEDTQEKFKMCIEKIINEGSGGVICILL
ncbi:MAG: stage IV sporulation protein A [Lachnospirales bacterium]